MNDLLKFITCGSVDDGKSTLIGHMLYDAKLLFADQERALDMESRLGSNEGELDYSLLLDGLMAEREQGITIDVAYRYFTTTRRSFIVADTPGHEEYTRNMAVGASFADLSVILVDAAKGVLIQTKRHARICALMGIRHFVFAVNKMDTIYYDKARFSRLKKDIRILMAEFEFDTMQIIPVSATKGDNVTEKSPLMPWYEGPSLLTYLEEVDVSRKTVNDSFILPIQRVCRPNYRFRGFQGQISCGTIKVGDEIHALPSGEKAVVTGILEGDRQVEESSEGQAVTLTLGTEIDISRGSVIEKNSQLSVGNRFAVSLLWMDESPLIVGKSYYLCIGTQMVPATIMKIRYQIDVNSGTEIHAESIRKNELAVCEISTGNRVVYDEFAHNKDMGACILIDRVTNHTSACGTVVEKILRDNHLTWQNTDITRSLRENHMNQKAVTVWLTGLSGAGKSTIANELEKLLFLEGRYTMLLDGDNVRHGLNKGLSFSESDRIENIRRIAEVAKLMNEAGLIVMTSFISPFAQDRRRAAQIIGDSFVEVYVSTSLEECENRDVKGLYKAARAGKIENFTGISSPYEVPENPDIIVDTVNHTPVECAEQILNYIKEKFLKTEQ